MDAGGQTISMDAINILPCHHHLCHSDEGILHVAEGSFRAEETGTKKEGNIDSPRQRMSGAARLAFYHV